MKQVLVVDDEFINRTGIKKMVELYPGCKLIAHTAGDGMEALDMLAEHAIHIVLTDIRMPKMDGLALCEQINNRYPEIQVLVISGYDDFAYAKQAMRFGARDYLLKPVLPADLFEVLDKLSVEWDAHPKQISLSEYDAWMEKIEETMWSLDTEQIPNLLKQWEEHCSELEINSTQLSQLLKDCLVNISKRMAKRSFKAQVNLPENMETLSSGKMHELFAIQMMSMADQLASMRGAKYRNPFEEAKAYINTHLAEEITLDEMAQRVGMSSTYFSHLFRKETNESFVQYRIRKRMEKAKELLELPHYRIIDICQAVGFSDYPHFTKTFKKYAGCSPSEYRARMGIE